MQATDITDLANATIHKYGRNFLVDAMTELRDYTACRKLIDKNRMAADGGDNYVYGIIHTADSNARAVGFYEVDDTDSVTGTVQATIPWRFINTSCQFDTKELSVNAGAQRIFNLLKSREYQMWTGLWALMEQYFWDGPTAGSTDTKIPFGLFQYWLDYDASTGFNGGNHANWASGPGGVSAATYSRHSHYTFNYTGVSNEDAVAKTRRAIKEVQFRGIPNAPIKDAAAKEPDQMIYTTLDNQMELADLAMAQDDQIGSDLGKYDGKVTIARVTVEEVPYLSANKATSDPIVGLDWSTFKTVHPEGEWRTEGDFEKAPLQHTVRQRQIDWSLNYVWHNRRRLFLGAKASPLTS